MSSTEARRARRPTITEIKQAARGRWAEILTALAGITTDILDGRHHACPKCGGEDRFRAFDDFRETGGVFCNQCHADKNHDGVSTLQWAVGIDFKAAIKLLADHLGIEHRNGRVANGSTKKHKLANNVAKVTTINPNNASAILEIYGKAKPPITAQGIKRCGGLLVRWRDQTCIRFDARVPADASEPTAIILVRADGEPFPAVGNLGERKTHTVGGSVNSWLASTTAKEIPKVTTILDVEGVTDLLAVVSAGLPDGWVAVTNTAGAKARGKLPREWAVGKRIIVVGDADEPGQDGAKRAAVAYRLAGVVEVLFGQLPYPIEQDHGKDLRDWLLEGHAIADLSTVAVTAEEASVWSRPSFHSSEKTSIIVTTDEEDVANQAIRSLSARDDVYQRGGVLVHVVRDQEPPRGIIRPLGAPRIAGLPCPTLRERMASSAVWLRPSEDDDAKPCHVPEWAVKAVDSRGTWQDIRQLEAVSETPLLLADGGILQTPGYDESSGILYLPATEFPTIPHHPSPAAAKEALKDLCEVWSDVPFASETDLAVVVALTLTPLSRHSFRGPVPLFVVESNTPGAGKTLTADACAIVSIGRPLSRASAPNDNEEARKMVTSVVMGGERMILLDNIGEAFGWPALDAALTGNTWTDRILGTNRMLVDAPLTAIWVATGNNLMFRSDVIRRTLLCRLESLEECPEERSDFLHPDLLGWVTQNRGRLVSNALTILRGYRVAGCPSMGLRSMGSFEGWSAAVREPVVWAGLPDPAGGRRELARRADQDAIGLRRLIEGWSEIDPDSTGLTIAEAVKMLDDNPTAYTILRSAIAEIVPARSGKTPSVRSIGMKLHHLHRRVVGGHYLEKRDTRLGAVWFIGSVQQCATSATSATISGPSRVRAQAHARTRENSAAENSPASGASPAVTNLTSQDHAAVEEFLRT